MGQALHPWAKFLALTAHDSPTLARFSDEKGSLAFAKHQEHCVPVDPNGHSMCHEQPPPPGISNGCHGRCMEGGHKKAPENRVLDSATSTYNFSPGCVALIVQDDCMSCSGDTCIGLGSVSPMGANGKTTRSAHGVFVTSARQHLKISASS
eukprot:CAMPEP_0115831966 /NCGR_PEP_ID=MMETSP0287-20121206/2409_1 /TAXON_ID=412157 /ORGANISM="Chrysochromulina rotalis, Strain UIO044" /LENGTH=150 /DNA_ID=CAMNT_0003285325 /DNA_START=424 /DNA_END=878 /DNA_ORIENTATION=-